MDKVMANLEGVMLRVTSFSSNTRKSKGKLTSNLQVSNRRKLLCEYWFAFEQEHLKMTLLARENADVMALPYFKNNEYFDVEEAYQDALNELDEISERNSPSTSTGSAAQNASNLNETIIDHRVVQQNIRMVPINPPTFSGDVTQWTSFRDLFQSVVIANASLSAVQRLQYLKMACKGDAEELLRDIAVTDANFAVAWAELKSRYENTRVIVSKLVDRLLNIKAMCEESASELKRLLDGTNQTLRTLQAMGRPTQNWDDLIVVHTVRKLDASTRKNWERQIAANDEMPTYEQLKLFLEKELRSLEAMMDISVESIKIDSKKKVVRSHYVDTKVECGLCKGAHGLYACDKFLSLSVKERREFIGTKRICFNCIGSDKHISRECKSKFLCKTCARKHHTLLHEPKEATPVNSFVANYDRNNVLLATAVIVVKCKTGKSLRVRALIDPGSHATFVTENVIQQLGSVKAKTDVNVYGVGESSAGQCSGSVELIMFDCMGDGAGIKVTALVMKRITSKLPPIKTKINEWSHLNGLMLADRNFSDPAGIDILLGADVYPRLMLGGVKKDAEGPLAQETVFGWVLTGQIASIERDVIDVWAMHVNLDVQLQRFWEIEEVGVDRITSVEDLACEKMFIDTVQREVDGRYSLQLPFRTTMKTLGESRSKAVQRLLQMEKRFSLKNDLYEQYKGFMDTYLEMGHMEIVKPSDELLIESPVYLPHHAVLKPTSTSTKLRVVFDASAKTSSGVSLNDTLLTGARLQDDLSAILIRWRQHKVALSADVEKMYRQIWVAKEHRDYQRIVWRRTPYEPIQDFRLKTITYGTASAPYMAVRAMQKLGEDEKIRFPQASRVVKNDFYMDDCLTGADCVHDALKLKDELMGLMQSGGFPLLKWSSNSPEVLHSIPENNRECQATLNLEEDDTVKALGIHWHPASDQFGFRVTFDEKENENTKRRVLSDIAKLFDPLSLLAPVIVTAKIIMQKLWLLGIEWDEKLPKEIDDQWRNYRHDLSKVENIRIPRWLGMRKGETIEFHGFSDASKVAYAACVYMRVCGVDEAKSVRLIAAKTKVAPIKTQSIPRLELNGAVLLCKLLGAIKNAMDMTEARTIAWTDSTVVLAWLKGHANQWPTFIANRVTIVQSSMSVNMWRHVPGADNPADVASRGIMPADLENHPLWWFGPKWLREDERMWPESKNLPVDEEQLEKKKMVFTGMMQVRNPWDLINKYSSLERLLRITALCKRVFRKRAKHTTNLDASELQAALMFWVKHIQEISFEVEIKMIRAGKIYKKGQLNKLNPFLDPNGMLRVGGRLQNSMASYDEIHPLILPKHGTFIQLLIADAHERVMHYGPKQTTSQLQQRFWILGVRSAVRAFTRRCVVCFRARPETRQQLMGQLPTGRVTPSRAFLHTAIDYAGPIRTRTSKGRGHKANKSWIAVFICLASKAIHLELVSELSTDGFLSAFRRFTARRGHCSDVYCDNGTNFVGAAGELSRHLHDCIQDELWNRELCSDGTQFHFSPAGSPHFNGLAEAAVKMAKSALRKVIGEHTLTFEEMTTFLAQVEAILNSRPISATTRDPDDASPLTPGHFLIGQPLSAIPERNLLDRSVSSLSRWKLVQRLMQQFWKRWTKEYLHSMQQRQKWQTTKLNVSIGDIVIIRDEQAPPTKWRMGKIEALHPGDDGIVRVVTVRAGSTIIKRSIVKICVLPIEDNSGYAVKNNLQNDKSRN